MDIPHGIIFMILRPWLTSVCLVSILLLVAMVIINRLQVKGYLSLREMLRYGEIVSDVCIGKIVLWGAV
jgi:hypothetical protein